MPFPHNLVEIKQAPVSIGALNVAFMKYKHIIWDWNGTLWDDTGLCVEINNHMLPRRNLPPITRATYRDKLCFPVTGYYCQLGFDYAVDPYNALAEEFIAEYGARRFECALQAEARELIESRHASEITQAVLSAYQQEALLQATDYFELTPFFQDIIGLNDIYASGKVGNGLQYMARLAIDPADVLFVGDTISGFFDFYFAGHDSFVFDIAVTLNDWCVHHGGDLDGVHDEARAVALMGAYQAVRPLSAAERQLLGAVLRAGALRFWLSRLWDLHLPREASMLQAHDPAHFERVLRHRVATVSTAVPALLDTCLLTA